MKSLNRSLLRLVTLLLLVCIYCHAYGAGDLESAPLDSYQIIPTAESQFSGGILRYNGVHHGRRVIVQAFDSGTLGHEDSLAVYVQDGKFYRLVLSMLTVERHGFRCSADGDQLKMFWAGSKKEGTSKDSQPFVTLDISELLTAFTKA